MKYTCEQLDLNMQYKSSESNAFHWYSNGISPMHAQNVNNITHNKSTESHLMMLQFYNITISMWNTFCLDIGCDCCFSKQVIKNEDYAAGTPKNNTQIEIFMSVSIFNPILTYFGMPTLLIYLRGFSFPSWHALSGKIKIYYVVTWVQVALKKTVLT
jgi:hypothetical protein